MPKAWDKMKADTISNSYKADSVYFAHHTEGGNTVNTTFEYSTGNKHSNNGSIVPIIGGLAILIGAACLYKITQQKIVKKRNKLEEYSK